MSTDARRGYEVVHELIREARAEIRALRDPGPTNDFDIAFYDEYDGYVLRLNPSGRSGHRRRSSILSSARVRRIRDRKKGLRP